MRPHSSQCLKSAHDNKIYCMFRTLNTHNWHLDKWRCYRIVLRLTIIITTSSSSSWCLQVFSLGFVCMQLDCNDVCKAEANLYRLVNAWRMLLNIIYGTNARHIYNIIYMGRYYIYIYIINIMHTRVLAFWFMSADTRAYYKFLIKIVTPSWVYNMGIYIMESTEWVRYFCILYMYTYTHTIYTGRKLKGIYRK